MLVSTLIETNHRFQQVNTSSKEFPQTGSQPNQRKPIPISKFQTQQKVTTCKGTRVIFLKNSNLLRERHWQLTKTRLWREKKNTFLFYSFFAGRKRYNIGNKSLIFLGDSIKLLSRVFDRGREVNEIIIASYLLISGFYGLLSLERAMGGFNKTGFQWWP